MRLIIDAGHGWFTKGKSSLFHKITFGAFKGQPILKENNINEAICNKLSVLRQEDTFFITNEWEDVSLNERVRREHKLYLPGDSLFMSIHADAFTKKDKAHGGTFFYYSEKGRLVAEFLTDYLKKNGYELELRQPKQANFQVLRETKSIGILFELGFMTSTIDLKSLMSEHFRNKTSELLRDAINSIPKKLIQ